MSKRYISLFLALIMTLTSLTACKKKEGDFGTIEDAEIISGQESDQQSSSIFEKKESSLSNYKFETVDFDAAKMTFEAPSNWREDILSLSCIKYSAPPNDPYIPNATIYIKVLYDYYAGESEFDELNQYAKEFSKPLAPYITGLPFKVEGSDAWVKSYSVPDVSETPSFCKDDTAACINITENPLLINKKTADIISFEGYDLITGHYRWENFPVMIATVVSSEKKDESKELVEYIMSSTSSVQQKSGPLKEYEYRDISFRIPSIFKSEEKSGNILRCPAMSLGSCAGMGVGVFDVTETTDILSTEYFKQNYMGRIASLLLDQEAIKTYAVTTSCYDNSENKLANEFRRFSGTVNIISEGEDYKSASNIYGVVSVWNIDCFLLEEREGLLVAACVYPNNEADMARQVEKNFITTLRIK